MTFWWNALEIISPTPAGVFQGLYLIYSFVFSKREVFLNGIKLQIIFDKVSTMKINLYSNNLVCINFVDNVNFLPLRDYTVDISGVSPSSDRIFGHWFVRISWRRILLWPTNEKKSITNYERTLMNAWITILKRKRNKQPSNICLAPNVRLCGRCYQNYNEWQK